MNQKTSLSAQYHDNDKIENNDNEKFYCIATEGKTPDGREIPAEHLKEMAEDFNPEKFHGARINIDHPNRFSPLEEKISLGDVKKLKTTEEENGKTKLWASLKKNRFFHDLITRNNQFIYPSIEYCIKYPETNKAYLTGLAVTNRPASSGTSKLCFSNNNNNNIIKFHGEPIYMENQEQKTNSNRLTNWLTFNNNKESEEQKNQDENFKTICNSFDEIKKCFDDKDEKIAKLSSKIKELENKDIEKEKQFTELKESLEQTIKLSSKIEELEKSNKEFSIMMKTVDDDGNDYNFSDKQEYKTDC